MNSDLTAVPPYTFCRSLAKPRRSLAFWQPYTLTYYTLAMIPSQNCAYTLGSPLPALACPFSSCPRRFNTKSGRTRHVKEKHPPNGSESHAPNTATHTSPTPPLSLRDSSVPSHFMSPASESLHHNPSPVPSPSHFMPSVYPSPVPSPFMPSVNPSPIPSRFMPSPSPSCDDPSPVPSHFMPSASPSCDGIDTNPDIDMDVEHPPGRPDSSRLTRVFHPKLNGMSIYFLHIPFQ